MLYKLNRIEEIMKYFRRVKKYFVMITESFILYKPRDIQG